MAGEGLEGSVKSRATWSVSLTYDGADPSHLETVAPCLHQFGLKGTFFGTARALLDSPLAWQAVANEGHEIGSHSLLGATDERGNLFNWTLEAVENDLRMSRRLLTELFPRQLDFSFAYPGDETSCMTNAFDPQPASYRSSVASVFEVARSAVQGLNDPLECDLGFLWQVDCESFDSRDMAFAVEQAAAEGRWLILTFHGVGSGERSVEASEHRDFCAWLAERAGSARVVTVWHHAMSLRNLREATKHSLFWRE
jgi:peptidoglycan/xylan/chitin deacetylase (PgdA/CDA1 family)